MSSLGRPEAFVAVVDEVELPSYSALLVLEPWPSTLWPVWLLDISGWALRRLGAAALRRTCAVCELLSHKSPRSALCHCPAALACGAGACHKMSNS